MGWYFDTDANGATGAQPLGDRQIGAEMGVALFGQAGGGAPVVELQRWTGSGWSLGRRLGGREVIISENVDPVLGAVGLQLPRADVGIPRGGTLGLVQIASYNDAVDRAPDTGQITLGIPATRWSAPADCRRR